MQSNPLVELWLRRETRKKPIPGWVLVPIFIVFVLTGGILAMALVLLMPIVIIAWSAFMTARLMKGDLLEQARITPLANTDIAHGLAYITYRKMRPFLLLVLVALLAGTPLWMFAILERAPELFVVAFCYFVGLGGLNVLALAGGFVIGLKVRHPVLLLVTTIPIFPPIIVGAVWMLLVLMYPYEPNSAGGIAFLFIFVLAFGPYALAWALLGLARRWV